MEGEGEAYQLVDYRGTFGHELQCQPDVHRCREDI